MRYKVGDMVVLKNSRDTFCSNGVVKIERINHELSKYISEDVIDGYFDDKDIIHEKTAELHEKKKIHAHYSSELEKIVAQKNGHKVADRPADPIEPAHYRKGLDDLYESAYRTRPFNEYRAIMEFVAERYIKRDKENRVEDLEKAIYTIERLKEKELEHD